MLDDVLSLLFDLAAAGYLKRAIFSRPTTGDSPRIDARLCNHKGELLSAFASFSCDSNATPLVSATNLALASTRKLKF